MHQQIINKTPFATVPVPGDVLQHSHAMGTGRRELFVAGILFMTLTLINKCILNPFNVLYFITFKFIYFFTLQYALDFTLKCVESGPLMNIT